MTLRLVAPARVALAGLASAAACLFGSLALAAQPESYVPLVEWVEGGDLVIPPESGTARPGPYTFANAPYARRAHELLELSHPANMIALCWAAQTGKSQVGANWALHTADRDPCGMLVVQPSQDELAKWNRKKWQPSVDASERLTARVREEISRDSQGSTATAKKFKSGFIDLVTASSSKGLQGNSTKKVLLDEVSEYAFDVGGRGDPVVQAIRRTDGQDEVKVLKISTPKTLPSCRITKDLHAGNHERFYIPCNHCGDFAPLDEDGLIWATTEREEAVHRCPSCGTLRRWSDLPAMEMQGVWLATFKARDPEANPAPPTIVAPADIPRWLARPIEGRDYSQHLPQWYSLTKSWTRIRRDLDAEEGDPERIITNDQQIRAIANDPARDAPDDARLLEAAKAGNLVQRGIIPHWAPLQVLTVDCQGDRLEWAHYAVGPKAMARVDWGEIYEDPAQDEAWLALAKIVSASRKADRMVDLGWDMIGIDSGGKKGVHARVYDFASRGPNIFALKGSSHSQAVPLAKGTRRKAKLPGGRQVATDIWLVGTDTCKTVVYSMLRDGAAAALAGERRPGGIYLTADSTEESVRQLVAEIWVPSKSKRADADGAWNRIAGRANEQLDLAVYAYALQWSRTSRWSPEQWAAFRDERLAVPEPTLPLFETAPAAALPARIESAPNPGAKKGAAWAARMAAYNKGTTS